MFKHLNRKGAGFTENTIQDVERIKQNLFSDIQQFMRNVPDRSGSDQGAANGTAHKSKPAEAVMKAKEPVPEWFQRGIEAALLAPTAMNQQKFLFTLNGNTVTAKAGMGFYAKVDLGIAKCHFEIGAGKENFICNFCDIQI